MRRSVLLLPFCLALGLAFVAGSAAAADLRTLRLQDGDGHVRAMLELSADSDYKVFALQNPDRLVLDLKASKLASGFSAPAPNGVVLGVRTGQPTAGDLRVVFDLAAGVRPKTYLQRESGKPLLVLELYGQPAAGAGAAATAAKAKTVEDVFAGAERELIVAVDAGHGGQDPGARGASGSWEKHITLAVARELARQIDAEPGMKAVLIRNGDVFIPLKQRYMKARQAKADLFISIHADAFHKATASGSSVFVLSQRGVSSEAARWLADQENSADLVGGVSLDDKDNTLAAVLLDLSQSATMKASEDVAGQVLAEMKRLGKTHKPQVERANFVVLRSPDVPSMLVETAFISNPGEEKKLNDPDHRRRLATAIVGGVRSYFSSQPPPGTWFAARAGKAGGVAREHVVARGDTLSLIAARYNVPMASLRAANRIDGDTVRLGERLRIPAARAGGSLASVAEASPR